MNRALFAIALLLAVPASSPRNHAQAGHQAAPSDSVVAQHHACLEQERLALERGEGFGMAMVADGNGYPGPRHVLAWKDELKLTAKQQAAIARTESQMHEQALARGREVLLAEEKLGQLFAQKRPEADLREQSFRVASLRAELRWVHLSSHLATRKLLTPQQLAAYQRLRSH